MNIITDPKDLIINGWYTVFVKGTKKVLGEVVFTSYDSEKDTITYKHIVHAPLKKLCEGDKLLQASSYDYCYVSQLPFPPGYVVHTRNPFYCRSFDALF